jgi:hypothetical protein
MKFISKSLVLIASFALASCGGGGGGSSSGGSAFAPPTYSVSVAAATTALAQNSTTSITVTIKKSDNTVPADGTAISLAVTPAGIGTVGTTLSAATSTSATGTTTAGNASFIFVSSGQAGTAHITASVTNPGVSTVATGSVDVAISGTSNPLITISPATSTLPLNPYPISVQAASPYPTNYLGSPFVEELAIQWRHANGDLVGGSSTVNVSITPVGSAAFSILTSTSSTTDQFVDLLGSGPVTVTGGVGTIFVHAGNIPGVATLSVTGIDPDTGQNITSQGTITIAGSATGLPTSINVVQANPGVYVNGSNGSQSELITAAVSNGNGGFISDPTNGQGGYFDNVQFQIVGPAGTDATLSAVNAAGKAQTGSVVVTNTHNGIANVTFIAGTQQGPVQVQATADRGDNNVDNGVDPSNAVTATTSVVVSDGKLYSLTLTSPIVSAILVNGVSEQATLSGQGGTALTIPPDPNGTYSLTVTAHGTDRQNNPVLPGTVISFGGIDGPLTTDNAFAIQGGKGDPAEGASTFAAGDGLFTTAGGGAGPGDTLIVFGKAVAGNEDLESALKIKAITSPTTLTTATPFNLNDTTGKVVNNGPVLPYIIGRGQVGNITSPSSTDANGDASTTLNYPVSQLGRAAAIWAQGTAIDSLNGSTKLITDVDVLGYPGLAPATITISPSPIPGGIATAVRVCIVDALQVPLPYIQFNFSFANLGIGTGSVDGINNAGTLKDLTGADGCVIVDVVTSGIVTSTGTTGTPSLTFSTGTVTPATATITASGSPVLLASPSVLPGNGGTVVLTLLDGKGTPIAGAQLTGTCTGDNSIGVSSGPGATDTTGKATATITAALDQYAKPLSGTCTFSTSTGTPTVTVKLQGIDKCLADPANSLCGGANLVLNATPSSLPGSGGTVTLTLLTGAGTPVPNVAIQSSCTAGVSTTAGPGVTGAKGTASVTIAANLDAYKTPGTGSCTFTTAAGKPTITVNVVGRDLCINDPTNANCGGVVLSVSVIGPGSVSSSPSGISCTATVAAPNTTCSQPFPSGTLVTLTAKPTAPSTNVTWGGGCSAFAQSPVATVALSASASCTATFSP